MDDFTPFLNLLNAEELDRQEKEHDREARRKRRQTRSRRGITLPDRESQRTVRSIVPIQGLKMVIPYQNENEDLIVPMQPVAEPFAIEESAVEIPEPSGQFSCGLDFFSAYRCVSVLIAQSSPHRPSSKATYSR